MVNKKLMSLMGVFFAGVCVFGQAQIGVSGTVEWDKMEIQAAVSLDLAAAGLSLPAGRTQGEALINSEYLRLIRPVILNLQVDSSSVIGDHIESGEWTLAEAEHLAFQARSVPPALSPDMSNLSASYYLDLADIAATKIRHDHPTEIPRTLSPVPAPAYTGIVIMASDSLPVHGMRSPAFLQPCLFPKIWDTDMNLIFERNMLNPSVSAMARYFPRQAIFAGGPSGLSREIAAVVGDRPLRIFAYNAFGICPTDPVISREDALLIISSETNRNLLREGKVAIILDNSALKTPINPDI